MIIISDLLCTTISVCLFRLKFSASKLNSVISCKHTLTQDTKFENFSPYNGVKYPADNY